MQAYEAGCIPLHNVIKVRIDGVMVETSVGRLVLNQVIPKELGFINKNFDKKTISATIDRYFRIAGNERTCVFLDGIKELGFKWATKGGMSLAIGDMIIPPEKYRSM